MAICGIKVRMAKKEGGGDDTALNGAKFQCCPLSNFSGHLAIPPSGPTRQTSVRQTFTLDPINSTSSVYTFEPHGNTKYFTESTYSYAL